MYVCHVQLPVLLRPEWSVLLCSQAYIAVPYVPALIAYIALGAAVKFWQKEGHATSKAMCFASCADSLFFFAYLRAVFACLDFTKRWDFGNAPRPQQGQAVKGPDNCGVQQGQAANPKQAPQQGPGAGPQQSR